MHNIDEGGQLGLKEISSKTRIIYGGPIKPDLAEEIIKRYDCDGFLMLEDVAIEDDFAQIIQLVSEHQFNKEYVPEAVNI